MDKQAAIDLLDNLLGMVEDNHESDYDTAIKMGIDALDALCDRACEYSKKQRSYMCDACRLGSAFDVIDELPSAQPETAKRIVGKSRDGMTLWYQCDMCNEPVDVQDNYCRGCVRRLIDE